MTTATKTVRKREPKPRQFASEGKRATITFRVRGDMYERLKHNADFAELSLSEEVERRLDLSLHMAADPFSASALRVIGENWRALQNIMGQRMQDSDFVRSACATAAKESVLILSNLLSTKEKKLVDSQNRDLFANSMGKASAWLSFMLQCEVNDAARLEQFRKNVIDGLLASHVEHEKKPVQPTGRLVGAAEAAAELEPVPGQLPDSIGGTALFDEVMRQDKDGDVTKPDPAPPAAPSPTRRRRTKAAAGA